MELGKLITTFPLVLLSGCCLFDPKPGAFEIVVAPELVEECPSLPTVNFAHFNEVLTQKIIETDMYYNCAGKHKFLLKSIRKLEDVKVIRVITPESERSSN